MRSLRLALPLALTASLASADAPAGSTPRPATTPAATSATSATPATAATPAAATPAPSAGPYALAIAEGIAKLREDQAIAAQLAFQRAVSLDARKSEAHYLLGTAMRRNGSLPSALETFRTAIRVAQETGDHLGEARARVAIVSTYRQMEGRADDVRSALGELLTFAEAHPDVLSPEVPRAELAASERVAQLAVAMEPVRARIQQREREARTSAPAHGRR